MFKKLILALALAAISFTAFADMRTVSRAYEVGMSDFREPGTANGTLAMRPCPDCDYQTLRVTSATRYKLNGKPVALGEFRQALQQNRGRDRSIIVVTHDIDDDVVTAVSVRLK